MKLHNRIREWLILKLVGDMPVIMNCQLNNIHGYDTIYVPGNHNGGFIVSNLYFTPLNKDVIILVEKHKKG